MRLIENLQPETEWLIQCFAVYLASGFVFSLLYYSAYRWRPGSFSFASDILSSREVMKKEAIEGRLADLSLLIDAFRNILESPEILILDENGARAVLRSGSRVLFKESVTPDQGGYAYEVLAYVRVYSKDDMGHYSRTLEGEGGLPLSRPEYIAMIRRQIPRFQEESRRQEENLAGLQRRTLRLWSYWDFLYFSTITQSTVGYGDILPNSTLVRAIVVMQLLVAYALLVVVINLFL